MQNNKVLKRIRYALKFRDKKMKKVFEAGGICIPLEDVNSFLVSDSDPTFKSCTNKHLHCFLNGLIIINREQNKNSPVSSNSFVRVSKSNANNLVIKKLKIAFSLTQDDVLNMFKLGGIELSTTEVNGILRGEKSKMYRECGDKYIRKFLKGLAIHLRSDSLE